LLKSYEELLEAARKQIPEKTSSGERFEPPLPEIMLMGTKTTIKNFDFICQKLRREGAFLAKYLSKELAIPSTIEGTRLVLHGKIPNRLIDEKLGNFISKYVLCKECGRPDTKLVDGEHGIKTLICEACGARAPAK
jgi:translation initiation factor 2 subunit 2